jgi:hypothetical protein
MAGSLARMDQSRAERIAQNEVSFRHLNEELGVMGVFLCECADPACREHVQMPRARYEAVRADPRRFFVKPGHEIPEAETVIDREESWLVVEKPPDVDHVVDP